MVPTNRLQTQYSQFTAEENERLRKLLREKMTARGWSGAAAARAMGVSPPTVAAFLRGLNGAGSTLVRGLEELYGRDVYDLLGKRAATKIRRADLPGWAEAVAAARAEFPGFVPDHAYATVGEWEGPADFRPSARSVMQLAHGWWLGAKADHVSDSLEREVRAQMAAEDAAADGPGEEGGTRTRLALPLPSVPPPPPAPPRAVDRPRRPSGQMPAPKRDEPEK